MAKVVVNGAGLAHEEAGAGPVVVFTHAALADRRMWEHQFHALSATHRVIRYDWRGYGDSDDAAGEYARHEDLLGLMDALDVERAALVGCSMGGACSLDATLTAPERVTSLTLVCSGLSGHEWPPDMIAEAERRIFPAVPSDRLAAYRARTSAVIDPADVASMADAQLAFFMPSWPEISATMCRRVFEREWSGPGYTLRLPSPPAKARLAEVAVPTLVVTGAKDAPWVNDVCREIVSGIPGARHVEFPDCGHVPPVEAPEEFTALLTSFLS